MLRCVVDKFTDNEEPSKESFVFQSSYRELPATKGAAAKDVGTEMTPLGSSTTSEVPHADQERVPGTAQHHGGQVWPAGAVHRRRGRTSRSWRTATSPSSTSARGSTPCS
jgi:hypothetical protein